MLSFLCCCPLLIPLAFLCYSRMRHTNSKEATLMRGTTLDSGGDNKEFAVMAVALDVRSFNAYASQLVDYPRRVRETPAVRAVHRGQ